MFLNNAPPQRQQHDLHIKPPGPMFDVIQVVLEALLKRGAPAPSVHLGPARNTRLHYVTQHVLGKLLAKLHNEFWPLRARAHNAHFALQHIPKLRQLVQAGPSEEGPDRSSSRIILLSPDWACFSLRVYLHGTVLEHLKGTPIKAHAGLTVEDRPRRGKLDQRC